MDLPAMDPCPTGHKARHDLNVVLPEDSEHDMTLVCTYCGALRRVPVTGALLAARLDDLDSLPEEVAQWLTP